MDRRTFIKGVAAVPLVLGTAGIAWEQIDAEEWVQIELPWSYIGTSTNVILPSAGDVPVGMSAYITNTGDRDITIKGDAMVYDSMLFTNRPETQLEAGGIVTATKNTVGWLVYGTGIS